VQPGNAVRLMAVALAATMVLAHAPRGAAQAQPTQFIPANFYWYGPYGAAGSGMAAGMLDYLKLLNQRDGGVRGVKFSWEKCDTHYDQARGIECYERAKNHAPFGTALVHPLSTAASYSLIERATADRIALVSIGYGRPDAADGRVFPYVYPLVTTYWSEAAAMVRYIGERTGGMAKLQGKRIVLLYHDSAYGKEPIPVLSALAARYGYELSTVGVRPPGEDQEAQWQRIGAVRPDWVIVWGWGAMTPAALKSAARAGFPRNRMLGGWWSAAEEDVAPAGAAAYGYIGAAFSSPGTQFPVIADIRSYLYAGGAGELEEPSRIGSVHYNRGLVFGIVTAEAVRVAQQRFGAGKPVTGEQVRWGLEHLRLDAERLQALGALGLLPPVETSCNDHEGSGLVRFMRWDGRRWNMLTDWMGPLPEDRAALRQLVSDSAAAYAKGKGLKPRSCPQD
jgi:branched-chain amino acid transport system substrate-binding protein